MNKEAQEKAFCLIWYLGLLVGFLTMIISLVADGLSLMSLKQAMLIGGITSISSVFLMFAAFTQKDGSLHIKL
ncbi:MAG: hypothetical protein WCK59_02810 [Candidatus Falkowbacteria bacterium]